MAIPTAPLASSLNPVSQSSWDDDGLWQETVSYFRAHSPIVVLSYCRFWEKHGFVQQSLVRALVQEGISVRWFDGEGWRPYAPHVPTTSPHLQVSQLFRLPGSRIPWVAEKSSELQANQLQKLLKDSPSAFLWVQGGIPEPLVSRLPRVDVYSVFDDPYRHDPKGGLCEKARLITVQNRFAEERMEAQEAKVVRLVPPVDRARVSEAAPFVFPEGFPKRKMGYVGSFQYEGFDFELFEAFVKAFPDWGFVLMGRTDSRGEEKLKEFQRYKNFLSLPWGDAQDVQAMWQALDLGLLFYRRLAVQDGAFPVKILDALEAGVPCLATPTPKTDDVSSLVVRGEGTENLIKLVPKALSTSKGLLRLVGQQLNKSMDPRRYLSEIVLNLSFCSP